jgi:hypothetical protein
MKALDVVEEIMPRPILHQNDCVTGDGEDVLERFFISFTLLDMHQDRLGIDQVDIWKWQRYPLPRHVERLNLGAQLRISFFQERNLPMRNVHAEQSQPGREDGEVVQMVSPPAPDLENRLRSTLQDCLVDKPIVGMQRRDICIRREYVSFQDVVGRTQADRVGACNILQLLDVVVGIEVPVVVVAFSPGDIVNCCGRDF